METGKGYTVDEYLDRLSSGKLSFTLESQSADSVKIMTMHSSKGLEFPVVILCGLERPMSKKGFFYKSEYVYDEYLDSYICPNNQLLTYRTTNRDGYREYKSCGNICKSCSYLGKCTESKDNIKTIARHI